MNIFKILLLGLFSIFSIASPSLLPTQTNVNFLSIGDWGGATLGGKYLTNVNNIASAMENYIEENDSEFIINTGDNFYYCGIQNTSDPQISTDYTNVFKGFGIDWYNLLGNHDYGYNVSAQLELNKTIPHWILPDRYYYIRKVVNEIPINLVVLDTNPCIQQYRNDNPKYWDPCGTQYPTCSINNSNDDFEGECMFHENIIAEDCNQQYLWFQNTISKLNTSEWIIIVGHHPVNQINVANFSSLIDQYADLYLNGHTHLLNYYSYNGKSKYITTGAGSMVLSTGLRQPLEKSELESTSVNVIWTKKITGFTGHTINGNSLTTKFYDTNGNELYSFIVSK